MNTTQTNLTLGAKLFLGSILALMLFGGVAMMAKAFRGLNESRVARAWPSVPGKVTRSTMSESTDTHRSSKQQQESAPSTYYQAQIEYEFQVAGVTYHGTRRTAVQEMNANRGHAESILRQYPVDQAVTVYYQPDDPSQCVLEPGGWGGFFIMLPLSLVFTGIPIVLFRDIWRARCPVVPRASRVEDDS
jgi:hypothetical protein